MSSFLGRTGTNIRVVLEYAKRAPCVLLLDEFDAIAKRRDDAAEVGELKRLVTVLLQEVDAWPADGLLIAATNHPELLDPAVWRRFERVVQFPPPSTSEVRIAIERLLGSQLDPRSEILDALASVMHGLSYADVVTRVNQARRAAVISGTSIPYALARLAGELCRDKPLKDRITVAKALAEQGHSQRTVSELTGISRDTLRKKIGSTSSRSKAKR
jgi:SpoVK/Ycf46/Vps4 family AAA+-type ATPase